MPYGGFRNGHAASNYWNRGRSRGGRWRHGRGRASFDPRVKVAVDVSRTRRGVTRTRREIKLSLGSVVRGEEKRREEKREVV